MVVPAMDHCPHWCRPGWMQLGAGSALVDLGGRRPAGGLLVDSVSGACAGCLQAGR